MTEIAKEYAVALFELAREKGLEKEYAAALHTLANTFKKEPEYSLLLESPNLSMRERLSLAEKVFEALVPEEVLSFLEILMRNGRLSELPICVSEYEELLSAYSRVAHARIISAVELTPEEKKKLLLRLTRVSGSAVTAEYEVDKSLIGGVKVLLDDRVIDGSIASKLREVKGELTK